MSDMCQAMRSASLCVSVVLEVKVSKGLQVVEVGSSAGVSTSKSSASMFSLFFSCGGCTTRILSQPISIAALAYTLRRICRRHKCHKAVAALMRHFCRLRLNTHSNRARVLHAQSALHKSRPGVTHVMADL